MTAPGDPYNAAGAGTATLELLENARRYNAWLVDKLAPFLGEDNFELGAGHGTLTAVVANTRNVVASEPSAAGREVLSRRFAGNHRVRSVVAGLDQLDGSERFDAVYSANVLEHVSDDFALIAGSANVLKPGGYFTAIVPAGGWLYSPFDAAVGHHRRYGYADRVRLTSLIKSARVPLELVTYRPFNPVGALGWFFRMRLLQRDAIPAADIERVDKLVPILRLVDHVPFGFGQNLLLSFIKCR